SLSEPRSMNIGVPQGSILGPLFFMLYVNYIDRILQNVLLFADDTVIVRKSKSLVQLNQQMQKAIDLLIPWLVANKLSLNVGKTKYMIIKMRHTEALDDFVLKINGVPLERVEKYKYLGIYFDSHHNW